MKVNVTLNLEIEIDEAKAKESNLTVEDAATSLAGLYGDELLREDFLKHGNAKANDFHSLISLTGWKIG